MKAALLHKPGSIPKYEEVDDPIPENEDQVVLTVRAASLKNIDRSLAAGSHYDGHKKFPAIVGVDGVGILEDGTRVYSGGMSGMMAEKAIVAKKRCIALPDHIDDITAAALPNPGMSAWLSLYYRAGIKPGETVFVNGATGVTGKMAVQLAKYFGAKKVIASGRNQQILETLPGLGADTLISLAQPDADIAMAISDALHKDPFDIIIDYVWGHPAEMILQALTGDDLFGEAHRTRYVSVGAMAGETIQLQSATLRSSAVEIYGAGGGSLAPETLRKIPELLLELMGLAASGKIKIETKVIALKDIEAAWQQTESGKRMVIVP